MLEDTLTKKIGRRPVFDKVFEDMLVKYALVMEQKLYGLTRMDMRRIAYQLGVKNNVPIDSMREQLADTGSKDFFRGTSKHYQYASPLEHLLLEPTDLQKQKWTSFIKILRKFMTKKGSRLLRFLIKLAT